MASPTSVDASGAGVSNLFFSLGESLPLINNGMQLLHGISGNQQGLERARAKDPIGPNGYLTQAIEHVPLVNAVVQTVHHSGGEREALKRARERDPIGTHGYITKLIEHIPIVSDGVMALHRYHDEPLAEERARAYSAQKLLSKDGVITRMAELLPVSNLFAAAFHEMNGDTDRASRALDLFGNWAQASHRDGPLWKVAELIPGTDALAFASHVQGGHYAHALRSLTKTSWVNVDIHEVTLLIEMRQLGDISSRNMLGKCDILPRQFSLVVGMSDLLTNFVRLDQEGHRRALRFDVEKILKTHDQTFMDLSKALIKSITDEKLKRRIDVFTEMIPDLSDWLAAILNRRLPRWRQESISWRLCAPNSLPPLKEDFKEALRSAFPRLQVTAGQLQKPGPVQLKPSRARGRLPVASATVSCLSFAGCCGLGIKVGLLAGAVSLASAAAELPGAAMRTVLGYFSTENAASWHRVMKEPQPPVPSLGETSRDSSHSSINTSSGIDDQPTPLRGASESTCDPPESEGLALWELTSLEGMLFWPERKPHGGVPASASSDSRQSSCSRSCSPEKPGDGVEEPEPGNLPKANLVHGSDAAEDGSRCHGGDGLMQQDTGLVLELSRKDIDELEPLLREYLREAVFPAWRYAPRLGATLQGLSQRLLWTLAQEAVDLKAGPVPLVIPVDTEELEIELEGYGFNLALPGMCFALVLFLTLDGAQLGIERMFAAFPDALVDNVLQHFKDQLLGWDLRRIWTLTGNPPARSACMPGKSSLVSICLGESADWQIFTCAAGFL
eukprot:TRINITY_DN14259_c0_g1_i1.p1 TRINITY_DN14259_c0_g1~~TRINITY_DN14259_c0_g1_i1.p1  ORF type:complete len:787 (-),score=128.82 TRINITY_DN14259_c0_g1_i1:76-2436(-)